MILSCRRASAWKRTRPHEGPFLARAVGRAAARRAMKTEFAKAAVRPVAVANGGGGEGGGASGGGGWEGGSCVTRAVTCGWYAKVVDPPAATHRAYSPL